MTLGVIIKQLQHKKTELQPEVWGIKMFSGDQINVTEASSLVTSFLLLSVAVLI